MGADDADGVAFEAAEAQGLVELLELLVEGVGVVGALVAAEVSAAAAGVEEPVAVVLVVLVAPREGHGLGPHLGLPRDAGHVGEVGPPLAALEAVRPGLPHEDALAARGVVVPRDGPEVVRRDGDEDLAAAGVGLAALLGALRGEARVGAVLVVHKVVRLGLPRVGARLGRPSRPDRKHQSRVDARVGRHLRRDGGPAVCAAALPLTRPLLEAFQAEVVAARSLQHRNYELLVIIQFHIQQINNTDKISGTERDEVTYGDGLLGELHADGAVEGCADEIQKIVLVGRRRRHGFFVLVGGLGQELLAAAGLLGVGEGGVGLDGADGGDQVGGRHGGGGDIGGGAVGAHPACHVTHGGGAGGGGEAGVVPWSGARVARESLLRRRSNLARHAHAVAVAGELHCR